MAAIEVSKLKRTFKASLGVLKRKTKIINAVDGISFEVQKGELFGLLGPNGAGKTTTVKMLTTLLIPSSGSARIANMDIVRDAEKIRSHIGFIFGGERGLYWRLSGIDNLRYFASLYYVDPGIAKKRISYLMELVGLEDRGKEKVEGYSRGMKQRLHIARALIHDPEILFLDEPTIGLDPVGARELRQMVLDLQSDKKTILLTTHYMFEADALCQRIAVINHGRIIALDTPTNLKQIVKELSIVELEVFGVPPSAIKKMKALPFVENVTLEDHEQRQHILVQTPKGPEAVPALMEALEGVEIGKVTIREPTLEDAYVRLVGGES